jgi:hypothetical protein
MDIPLDRGDELAKNFEIVRVFYLTNLPKAR